MLPSIPTPNVWWPPPQCLADSFRSNGLKALVKYALAAIKFEWLRTCRVAQFGDCTPHGAMSLFLHTVIRF